jgi:hypothetical protein
LTESPRLVEVSFEQCVNLKRIQVVNCPLLGRLVLRGADNNTLKVEGLAPQKCFFGDCVQLWPFPLEVETGSEWYQSPQQKQKKR